jgi:hypothetical protein
MEKIPSFNEPQKGQLIARRYQQCSPVSSGIWRRAVTPHIRGGLLFRTGSNLRAIEEHFWLALFAWADALVRELSALGFDTRKASNTGNGAEPVVIVTLQARPEGAQGELKLNAARR